MFQKSLLTLLVTGLFASQANAAGFDLGSLVVSRTVYQDVGDVANLAVGNTLPGGGTAISDGSFPNVFKNETPDASFGVSSAIYLDQVSTSGALQKTIAVDSSQMVSSFASKSELALNVSTDGTAITFMGYKAAVGTLDVSNSNTSAAYDSTNPVTSTYQRAIGQVNIATGNVSITGVNAYSGNNGRAAVLANGSYYMVGNAGNGSGNGTTLSQLSDNTGVQTIQVGNTTGNTTAVGQAYGTYGSSTGYQRGFTLQNVQDPTKPAGTNYAADKTGKDDNFRGMTVFNNTLYVTKGSGSNGVDTVYQVGNVGDLANPSFDPSKAKITIMPGFNAVSEKVIEGAKDANGKLVTPNGTVHPFGISFMDANTMFVADEGTSVRSITGAATGDLEMWTLGSNGNWSMTHSYKDGLGGVSFLSSLGWSIKQDGLRNISGSKDADGSFWIYATTATVSDEATHDLGADPNELLGYHIAADGTLISEQLLDSATVGSRLGGVAYLNNLNVAAVPESDTYAMLLAGLGILGFVARRKQK